MEANDRKAAAEARRLKILARQQDRITRITGTYSQGSNADSASAADQPAAAPAAQETTAAPSSSSPAAAAQHDQPAAATAAAAPRPPAATKTAPLPMAGAAGTAAAATGAPPPAARPRPSPSRAPPSPSPSASALGSTAPAAPPSPTPSFQALPEDNVPSSSSAPSTFADQLRASTDKTRLLRCMSSLLLAFSIRYGMLQLDQLRLAPIPMLLISHTVLVVSAAALFGRGWSRAAQGNQAGSSSQVLLHLRERDWLAFVPGLRPMMTAFSSWKAFLASLGDDIGVYAFTFIFLSLLP